MRRLSIVLSLLVFSFSGMTQQKQGKVIFERTLQMQIQINENDHPGMALPKTRTDRFELLFGNNQSLWQASDEQRPEEEGPGGGVQIRMIGGGADDINFCDFNKGTVTEQREMFDKKFIIDDSLKKLSWKLTGETRTILNHSCQQAKCQRIGIRMMMNMDNGKMERKELSDTSEIVAWFTADIPVAAGPAEFQGQLPGLILELDINHGKQIFKAIELVPDVNLASIKEPRNGKKVSRDQFKKESQKMLDEMERNNQGGNRVMRINN